MDFATPRKKPRLDIENVEPFGDEPWDITEDQLEEFDILASQAITSENQDDTSAQPHRVATPVVSQRTSSVTSVSKTMCVNSFVSDPASVNSYNFSSSLFAPVAQPKKLYQKTTSAAYPKANVVNTYNPYVARNASSVSGTNSLSISSARNKDVHNLAVSQRQSQSGVHKNSDTPVNFGRHVSSSSITSVKVECIDADANNVMLKKLQVELTKCKDQVKQLTEEQDAKVGEVKLLRENLSRTEAELDLERQERIRLMTKQSAKYEADSKVLQGNLSKAKTELTFLKQELLDKQTKCHQLESRLKQCNLQESCTPRSTSVCTATTSPKKVTPPKPNAFLARFSFDKSGPLNTNVSLVDASVQVDAASEFARRRNTRLRTNLHQGLVPGVKMMSHLLHDDVEFPKDSLGGILSLLQVQSSKDLVLISGSDKKMLPSTLDRNMAFYPKQPGWSSSSDCSSDKTADQQTNASTQVLAVQGLEILLHGESQEGCLAESAAVLISFIEDRIVNYRDVLRLFSDSQGLASVTSTLSSYKSSSLESYFSSISPSPPPWLNNVQLTPATLEQMEAAVTVALVVFHKMVSLRPRLMGFVVGKTGRVTSDCELKIKDEARSVATDTHDTNQDRLESSSPLRVGMGNHPGISPIQTGIDFIEHVIKTTHVALAVEKLVNPDVVAAFLEVLLDMVTIIGESAASRIKWLFLNGTFNNCFRAACGERVVILCLRLAKETVRYSSTSSSWLCGRTQDVCFLYQVGIFCQQIHSMFAGEIVLRTMMQIFRFLSTVVSTYHRSAPIARDSDTCGNCCRELLLSLICMFNKEVAQYRRLTTFQAHLVRDGVRLLHQLSSVDNRFGERRAQSEKQYVTLVCKITKLMSQDKDKFLPLEVTIIQELKDFESDEDDLETDPEHETSMETGPG